jgi:hypothetical protein
MTRFDLFGAVHKGLRAALFDAVVQTGRVDFEQSEDALKVAAVVRRALGFLAEHAEHEEREVFPDVARLSAELAAELAADHSHVGGLEKQIRALLDRIPGAAACERVSIGRRLAHRLALLTAEQLEHMEREETVVNRLLWAHRADEQLLVLHARVVASIGSQRMAEWTELLLPALSARDRDQLQGELATGAAS